MSPEELVRRVKIHNAVQLAVGIGLIPVSILLWFVSFWFFHIAFYMPLRFLFDSAWTITFYVAWLCMIPLAIEGVRHTRPLFSLSEMTRSGFYDNFLMQTESGFAISWYYNHPTLIMFWVTQVLYAAPRTMVLAIKSLRCFLPADESTVRDAARILGELRASRKWALAEQYKDFGAALVLLRTLRLIWTEDKSGDVTIRYPAGSD
jgi:hypothetical protein